MDKLIAQAHELFKNAGFGYAICDGTKLDLFASKHHDISDFGVTISTDDKPRALQFLHDNGWGLYARYVDTRYPDRRPTGNHLHHLIEDPLDTRWDDCENVSAILPDSYVKPIFLERAGVHVFKFEEPKNTTLDFIKIVFDKQQS